MKKNMSTNISVLWIRIVGTSILLFSILGLFMTIPGSAQNKKPGFEPGSDKFTNPFTNIRKKTEEIIQQKKPISNPSQVIQINSGKKDPKDVPDPQVSNGKILVGGDENQGITTNTDIPNIPVDTLSAIGGRQVITDFNFLDADIVDIAKTMGKLTGKNFILDKDVKGQITIISNSPITVSDAWKAFLTTLDINGYTVVQAGKYIRIARQRDARDKQLETFTGEYSPSTDALITRVFPLKFINADEVARVFRSFMPANSRVIPHNQTNTVIVTDTGSNIKKLEKILTILDIEGFDAGIEVIPVKWASAVEIAKLVDTLIPGAIQSVKRKSPRVFGGKFAARKTKQGGIINAVIADERTNSLIVHANENGTEEVKALVVKLDKKRPANVGGGKIHVVYLQFADAEDVAKTLGSFSQNAPTSRSRGARSSGINPNKVDLFEGAIKVAADKSTNSLVITASPSDLVTVQRVISKLDIPRDEVFVEVVIMEMALSSGSEISTNVASATAPIAFVPQSTDLASFLVNPIASKGLVLGLNEGGTGKTFNINGTSVTVKNIAGLIKAIQTESKTNILATPQILTLDNKEATFEISERIPVPTTTANQNAVVQSITKENIGLSVTLKPQINKMSNFVKLDIKTKSEDISGRELPAQVADQAFATIQRQIETTVVVADSDTVVLGGLIRDKTEEQASKIPILGDIPVLGWLFRAKKTATTKTNLLMFITPHVVRQYEKVRSILDKKLQERDDFISKQAGGNDPLRPYRDKIIRELPDIKDVVDKGKDNKNYFEDDQESEEDE